MWRWVGEIELCGILGVVFWIRFRVDTKVLVTGGCVGLIVVAVVLV